MYQWIVKRQIRKGFEQISAGDFEGLLTAFAPQVHFTFAGDHALGANVQTLEKVREWFQRIHALFPTLKIEAKRIFVAGLPWDMVATTQFHVSDTLPDGSRYDNDGVQVLRIRFGKVVEDHLIEETVTLNQALAKIAPHNQLANASPLVGKSGEQNEDLEHRRHSIRENAAEHLNQAGVTLARQVGETMGHFERIITSPMPRAFETAIAMGYAVHEQVEWLATYPLEMNAEMPNDGAWTAQAQGAIAGPITKKFAQTQADYCHAIIQALPKNGHALLISHGGFVELTTIGILHRDLVQIDFDTWGGEVDYCEGVRLTFEGNKCTHAERLWVKR